MGLDPLNTKAIDANVVDPFLDRLKGEIIPALEAVVERRIDEAVTEISNTIHGTLVGVQAIADSTTAKLTPILKLANDLQGLVNELQELVARLNSGGEISLRLSAPPK